MLSASIHIHRNILCAQCYILYCDGSPYDAVEVECNHNELCISVLHNNMPLQKCHIMIPEDLFRPHFIKCTSVKTVDIPRDIHQEHRFYNHQPANASLPAQRNDSEELGVNALGLVAKRAKSCSSESQNNVCFPKTILTAKNSENCQSLLKPSAFMTVNVHSGTTENLNEKCVSQQLKNTNSFEGLECRENSFKGLGCRRNSFEGFECREKYVTQLSFRLQVSKINQLDRVLTNASSPTDVKDFLKQKIKENSPCKILCSNCENSLMAGPLCFQKVEECCEGLISELSEGWFCHAETATTTDLLPQSLYFDSVFFYLHQLVLENLLVERLEGGGYVCRTCSSLLSSESKPLQDFSRFYCDKIMLQCSDSVSNSCFSYRFQMAWMILWSLIMNNQKTALNCKLYLHSKNPETCLLLWVLSEKVPQFLLRERFPLTVDLKLESVYKVLYHIGPPCSTTVKSWRHDFTVDFYKVSDSMMSIVTEFLKESSNYIPGGNTLVNGLSHGCLPTRFPGS